MSNHPHMQPNGNIPGPPMITVMPGPIDVQVLIDQVQTPGGTMVMLRFATAVGMAVYFLPIDTAKKVAEMIKGKATPLIT